MKRLAWLLGVPFALWLVVSHYYVHEHRFRIILDVDTPEGLRRGSSVWSVTCHEPLSDFLRAYTGVCNVRGEAVFLELPQGRSLIALMALGPKGEGVDLYDLAPRAFGFTGIGASGGWYSQAPTWTGSRILPPGRTPTIVTFTDLKDPTTAKVVYATSPKIVCNTPITAPHNADGCKQFKAEGTDILDRFPETFGPGTAFKGLTLEMVPVGWWPLNLIPVPWPHWLFGVSVTRGIEGKVPVMMVQLRELDKSMQLVHPNDPLRVRSGHLSVR
ncbi:MAG: hypothetical protein ACKVON_00700 [Beijerinckiaceae bacterium]